MPSIQEQFRGRNVSGFYFDDNGDKEDLLVLVLDNRETATINFNRELYETLIKEYLPKLDMATPKGHAIINMHLAIDAIASDSGDRVKG